ncbi:MAG: hypothetical protein OEZ38_09930, partial [Gammaproteobacteria bacterium]|nr:hypothetical protein [Gammaproteobacteria bacterium]
MAIKQHKIRSNIIVITAIAVIFSALIFTLLRASIPYLTNYGEDFEKVLSEQLGLPVEIAMVDADISWLVPRLKLLDVSVYDKDHEKHLMHFREISISLNWIDTIRNLSLELGDVFVFGMDIQVERNEQGVFLVQGIKIEKSDSSDSSVDEINSFFSKTSLYIVDSAVRWIDRSSNLQEIVLTNLNLTMINSGSDHEISIDMDLPDSYGRHLKIISEFEGDITRPELWQGELYVSAINLRLNNWLNDYWELVDFPGSGQLSMDAWVDFKDFSVHKATASLKCNDLVLYYLGEDVESWALDHISMKFQWSQA